MGRVYTVVFENVAVTVSSDLFELTPADDKPVRILRLELSQNTELGDAAEEQLRVTVTRGNTTGGSGGSAPTPRPVDRSGAAAGFAAEVNNTTKATSGTTHQMYAGNWNIRVPLDKVFLEKEVITASQADTVIVVRLEGAPADSVTMSGTLTVEEEG